MIQMMQVSELYLGSQGVYTGEWGAEMPTKTSHKVYLYFIYPQGALTIAINQCTQGIFNLVCLVKHTRLLCVGYLVYTPDITLDTFNACQSICVCFTCSLSSLYGVVSGASMDTSSDLQSICANLHSLLSPVLLHHSVLYQTHLVRDIQCTLDSIVLD